MTHGTRSFLYTQGPLTPAAQKELTAHVPVSPLSPPKSCGLGNDRPSAPPGAVSGCRQREEAMESYQWFLLGMMAAWMPSIVALALLLPRSREPHPEDKVQSLSDV